MTAEEKQFISLRHLMMFRCPGYGSLCWWTFDPFHNPSVRSIFESKSHGETERIWIHCNGISATPHKFHWNSQQLAVKSVACILIQWTSSVKHSPTWNPFSSFPFFHFFFSFFLQGKSITHKLVHLLSLASAVTCQCSLLLIFGLTDGWADSRVFSKRYIFFF